MLGNYTTGIRICQRSRWAGRDANSLVRPRSRRFALVNRCTSGSHRQQEPHWPQSARSAALGLGGLLQLAHRALEVLDVLEALVDGGEPQVGDVVEQPQPLEHGQAEALARGLGALTTDLLLHLGGQRRDRALLDRAVGDGALDAGGELVAVERLALPRPLHDHQRDLLEPLVGRPPAAADEALAPAADRRAVLGQPRVDDLVVDSLAERAPHDSTVTGTRPLPHDTSPQDTSRRPPARRPRASTRPDYGLARSQRRVPPRVGERVDHGPGGLTRGQLLGDRPERVARLDDVGGVLAGGRGWAALGDCEG